MGISGLQYVYGPITGHVAVKKRGQKRRRQMEKSQLGRSAGSTCTQKLAPNFGPAAGRNQLACVTGSDQGTIPNLIDRFLTAYGSPNYIRAATAQDAIEQAIYLTQGKQGTPVSDIENADFILSFGSGILRRLGRYRGACSIFTAVRKYAKKIIQVEPRLSDTAAKANQWLGINPGTETALALSLASCHYQGILIQ